jgi:hypothetical protein
MMGGDERFYAWLDGELSGEEAAAMAARVAADPELSRMVEEDRALKARLAAAFGPVAEAPAPERLQDAARGGVGDARIVDFATETDARQARPRGPAQWMAMAASLGVGVLIGASLLNRGPDAPVEAQAGALYAAGDLETGLNAQLANAPADGPVRIGITYRDRSGSICRTFTAEGSSGLACRDRDRWRLEAMVGSAATAASDYRMATSIDPVIADRIASSISGEPFGPAQEQAAKRRGWTG